MKKHRNIPEETNFESAIVTIVPQNPNTVYASDAIPGWTAFNVNLFGTNVLTQIGYDTRSLGGGGIFLDDTNNNVGGLAPLQGRYSVLLEGSSPFGSPTPTAFSIGQTGQVPLNALSLLFYLSLNSSIQVAFNGQMIPLVQAGSRANYNIMGGDISAFAGQTGLLMFTALPNIGYGLVDNIQFSSDPVPEPNGLTLTAFGTLLLGLRRRNNSTT